MAKVSKEALVVLEGVVNEVVEGLPKTKTKRMFGCHGLFANDAVFGLVWKEGRIGVRLPEEKTFESLMKLKGSAPWKAGKMTMSHWVLVPPSMHKKKSDLAKWMKVAHTLALRTEKKVSKRSSDKTA